MHINISPNVHHCFSQGKVFEVKWIQSKLPNLIVPHAQCTSNFSQCTSFFSQGKVFEVKWIQSKLPKLIVPHAKFFFAIC